MLYLIQDIDAKDMAVVHLDKGFVLIKDNVWTYNLEDFILTPPLRYDMFDDKHESIDSIETYITFTNEKHQKINICLLASFNTEKELSDIFNLYPELLL